MPDKTIVALYDDFEDAVHAIRDLEQAGFQHKDIALAANNAGNRHDTRIRAVQTQTHATDVAGTGAVIGTIAGGGAALLASLGVLAIPGIGPVLAAGPIIATITGAGVGAAAGGLIGGLVGMGVPADEAEIYAEGVRRGGALVTARVAGDQVDRAIDILERHDAVDVEQRHAAWRERGWSRFDERSEPWTVSRIDEEQVHWKTGGAAGPVAGAARDTTGAGMGEALTFGAGMDASFGGLAGNAVGSNDNGRDVRADAAHELPSDGRQGRPTEPKRAEPGVGGASRDDVIHRSADLADMRGGPQPTAMSGMFGSTEGAGHAQVQDESLKRGDTGRGRVRIYGGISDATPKQRAQAEMDRRAAGDKPNLGTHSGELPVDPLRGKR